ncbi:MAG: DinB family protein [Acidobacteriia bacterium]|nr:DinB family protein [Terriglobia bacterium]
MKHWSTVVLMLALSFVIGIMTHGMFTAAATPLTPQPPATAQPLATVAGACERDLNFIEKQIVAAAEAMPEDKYDFTPESLHIKGSAFDGVRTFGQQVRHLAADNYAMWSPVAGQAPPPGLNDPEGPYELRKKADIIKFLKGSFALGHKAIGSLTTQNEVDMLPFRGRDLPRLFLANFALTHANDHYGQMVVYLRMNGIVPPGSM